MPDIKTQDYTLEREKQTDVDKRIEATEIPIYMERLELSQEQKDRIIKEILEELQEIEDERETEKMDEKDDALDRQYAGELAEGTRMQFNLNRRVTKIKVDKITSLIMQSIFDSDPKFSVSPRPEFAKEGGQDVCEAQADYLDYTMDNLPFRDPMGMAVHSGVLKGLGYLKLFHEIERVDRRREERYAGVQYTEDPETKQKVIADDTGLRDFLTNYPDAGERYPGLLKDILAGKEINIISKYKDTIYNDPMPRFVNKKDLYVRKSTEGYHGMRTAKLLAEKKVYSWWELEKLECNEQFYDTELLANENVDGKEPTKIKKYKNKNYDILECTFFTKLQETDEDYTRGIFWISKEKKVMVGSILYPYFSVDCVYFPIVISKKKTGLYQCGIGEDLTDTNIAESAILNFVLEGAYISNMITPITEKDSEVDRQFLEKRWTHGIPLYTSGGKPIDFLQKYMKPTDIGGLLLLMQHLLQTDDDVTRVSAGMSGKESPLDPSAPASKTIALLQQSGIGIKDYVDTIAPCVNEIANAFLQLQYQMSKEGRKYRPRTQAVVGKDPFKDISRNAMVARTNIQTQAASFDFDKQNEKREDLALYQVLRQELLVARNPNAVYAILKNIIKSWSPKWKNNIDQILPPLEEFQREQVMTALKALALYAQKKQQDAQITGLPQKMKAEEFIPLMADLQAMIATPPDKEAIKEQEKNAKPV